MLGSAVYPAFVDRGYEAVGTDVLPRPVEGLPVEMLDVRDFSAVCEGFDRHRPDLVLHLAAETDVDLCEAEPRHAYTTNTAGTQHIAVACQQSGVPLVYVSTAGVFDGTKADGPYTEFDAPNPINVYGDSKYQGELLVTSLVPAHYIVRAGWMVGGGDRDHKFVAKITDQVANGADTIYAVDDKLGTPTYTRDFAENLLILVESGLFGTYHMACGGQGSRLDVASAILDFYGRSGVKVVPVSSEFFKDQFPAPRPRSEMMRNFLLELNDINLMRPWEIALKDYLETAGFDL